MLVKMKMKDHRQKHESQNLSCHDVITAEIDLVNEVAAKNEPDYSTTYKEFRVKKTKWNISGAESYQAQTARILTELLDRFKQVENIPVLTEIFSRMLVLSAEQNFETSNPTPNRVKQKQQYPIFSKQLTAAYKNHEYVCKTWRASGRPRDASHPAKRDKLESQQELRKIARESDSEKSRNLHNELMDVHFKDISRVCQKLKEIRGENCFKSKIPFVETLCGKYTGDNVLEGFCANTEILCNEKNDSNKNENSFFRMCEEDNQIIFELTSTEEIKIPHMKMENLKEILYQKLKLRKACDVYKITVEYLRNAGEKTLACILILLNQIISNLNYLSSTQLNTSIASIIHKGKDKAITHHKSYRQVRVTVLFGRIIDEYTRPNFITISRPMQNINQYGFTENISYLMAALQRHECEKYCIDMKKTFLGCSLDGESAFEVVDRVIQKRELYLAGESGEYWRASHYSYENSSTQIKMDGQLSRSFKEVLGVKQGHIRSSDNYTIYINSLLDTLVGGLTAWNLDRTNKCIQRRLCRRCVFNCRQPDQTTVSTRHRISLWS